MWTFFWKQSHFPVYIPRKRNITFRLYVIVVNGLTNSFTLHHLSLYFPFVIKLLVRRAYASSLTCWMRRGEATDIVGVGASPCRYLRAVHLIQFVASSRNSKLLRAVGMIYLWCLGEACVIPHVSDILSAILWQLICDECIAGKTSLWFTELIVFRRSFSSFLLLFFLTRDCSSCHNLGGWYGLWCGSYRFLFNILCV